MIELLILDLLCVAVSAGLAMLKIGGAIGWSWRWILIPLWIGLAIGLASLILLIAADEGYVDLD